MTIQTKLDIGETCYFMHENKVKSGKVINIKIEVYAAEHSGVYQNILYFVSMKVDYEVKEFTLPEIDLFLTKENLINSL